MSNKKQTAVDWLIEKLDNNLDINHSWRTRQYIKEAKEMEKEQMKKTMLHGFTIDLADAGISFNKAFELYIKETYGE